MDQVHITVHGGCYKIRLSPLNGTLINYYYCLYIRMDIFSLGDVEHIFLDSIQRNFRGRSL